jgi:CRP/FNR family transcriptional regulator
MQSALKALRKISYFSEMDEDLQLAFAKHANLITVNSGELLLLEDDPSDAVYVVETGAFKSSKTTPNGREHILRFVGAGETFNELNVLTQDKNQTTVTALERSNVYVIKRDAILDLLEQYPGMAQMIIRRLAGTVQFLLSIVEDLSLRSIDSRLARYLVEQASENTLHRPKWATQAELARHLGTVPNVLNRSLKTLEKENLISVKRHQIEILDLRALQARASVDK